MRDDRKALLSKATPEVESRRLEADHLYQTVFEHQLHKAGRLGETVH